RDEGEPAQLGKRGNDVLADAIGKIFLLRVVAHVGEREDGDRGPIQRRQGRWARLKAFAQRRSGLHLAVVFELAVHVADEPDASACDGADQFLFRGAVADRFARGVDTAGKGRVRHDPAAPDRGEKIILADNALVVLQKIGQDVEYLRLDGNRPVATAQLAGVGIKRMIGKEKLHAFPRERRPHRPKIKYIYEENRARGKDFHIRPGHLRLVPAEYGSYGGYNGKSPAFKRAFKRSLTRQTAHCLTLEQ